MEENSLLNKAQKFDLKATKNARINAKLEFLCFSDI